MQNLKKILNRLTKNTSASRSPAGRSRPLGLTVEALEDRLVPTVAIFHPPPIYYIPPAVNYGSRST
jgi:hypothetical protein